MVSCISARATANRAYIILGHIAKTNFDLILREERRVQAKLAVKDEYTFDFAELPPEYSGHELEMQLVNNIRGFLIEMGGDFTFHT